MRIRATRRGLPLTELGLGVAQFGNLYRETSDVDSTAAVDAGTSKDQARDALETQSVLHCGNSPDA